MTILPTGNNKHKLYQTLGWLIFILFEIIHHSPFNESFVTGAFCGAMFMASLDSAIEYYQDNQ